MAVYRQRLGDVAYEFHGLVDLLAKATPRRSGDELAGCAAHSDAERAAAQWALAEVPLRTFLTESVVPYESDEVTRLILDTHDVAAFAPIAHSPSADSAITCSRSRHAPTRPTSWRPSRPG